MRKFLLLIFTLVTLNATVPTYLTVTRLYIATFDRVPDMEGLIYWVESSGLSLEDIAISFMEQPESQEKYYPDGIIYLYEFVETVYINVFERLPDSAGEEYWVDYLSEGDNSRIGVFILAVINGALGEDAVILNNKTNYALDILGIESDGEVPGEGGGSASGDDNGAFPGDDTGTTPGKGRYCPWNTPGSGGVREGFHIGNYYCYYYSSGQLFYEVPITQDDVKDGVLWEYYLDSTQASLMQIYNNGYLVEERRYSQDGVMTSCTRIDQYGNRTSCM